MSILISVKSANFTFIKSETKSTSGNLSVQLNKLHGAGYIDIEKGYNGKIPCTTCRITKKGIEAFEEYVEALKSYLNF